MNSFLSIVNGGWRPWTGLVFIAPVLEDVIALAQGSLRKWKEVFDLIQFLSRCFLSQEPS